MGMDTAWSCKDKAPNSLTSAKSFSNLYIYSKLQRLTAIREDWQTCSPCHDMGEVMISYCELVSALAKGLFHRNGLWCQLDSPVLPFLDNWETFIPKWLKYSTMSYKSTKLNRFNTTKFPAHRCAIITTVIMVIITVTNI